MTDAEWAAVRQLLPVPAWLQGRGGQPEGYCHRQLLDAIRYLVAGGISWRAMPADFPDWARVYAFFRRWRENGLIAEFHDRLRGKVREREGREAEPTAGIIDAQSVRAAATVPAASRGYDGGKKVPGRKRHIVTDTLGLLLVVAVTAANIGDRDAAVGLLRRLRRLHRDITLVWADGGYTGSLVDWCRDKLALTLEIVKRTDDMEGFVVLSRRWVAEICQAQCTHGVCSSVSAVSVQVRRLYQPGGRVRRSRSSASSCWSAWAMSRWGQRLSRRVVIQPRLIQA
ncbi:IS5 family transposase [Streptomyces sp. 900105755]